MFTTLKDRFANLRTRLTHIGESESLSKLSLAVIILLDIFVLFTLFQGLNDNASQLITPEQYIPYSCQDFIVGASDKLDFQKLELVATNMSEYQPYYPDINTTATVQAQQNEMLHPVCLELTKRLDIAKSNQSLKDLFLRRSEILSQKNAIQYKIDELKRNYDTALLEKIASMQSQAEQMQKDRENNTQQLQVVERNLKNLETQILANKDYLNVWEYILSDTAKNEKLLEHDLNIATFWYPVKRLGVDFLFLLPLLLIVWLWNTRSVKKENGIQILLSSHLLVIIAIPTLWKILDAVLEIIPKKLLETIMLWLTAMKLLAIWYYILVIIAIFVALGIIYLIQKKIFSKNKLVEKRIIKGECISCGKKLPQESEFCPFCATPQSHDCKKCGAKTLVGSKFCKKCGEVNK